MTIKVLPKGGPNIRLWLPLGALKWRIVYRALEQGNQSAFDFKTLRDNAPAIVRALRAYVRRSGHFDLVNIHSHDGTIVKIRV